MGGSAIIQGADDPASWDAAAVVGGFGHLACAGTTAQNRYGRHAGTTYKAHLPGNDPDAARHGAYIRGLWGGEERWFRSQNELWLIRAGRAVADRGAGSGR